MSTRLRIGAGALLALATYAVLGVAGCSPAVAPAQEPATAASATVQPTDHAVPTARMGDLLLPARIGDLHLIHGEGLERIRSRTCDDGEGLAWPLGIEIVDASREAAHNDGEARLFNIYDFDYLTAQSAFYAAAPEESDWEGRTCEDVMSELMWVSVFRYLTEEGSEAALNIDLDHYDHARAETGLGCWDLGPVSECWGRSGALVFAMASHLPVADHADVVETFARTVAHSP